MRGGFFLSFSLSLSLLSLSPVSLCVLINKGARALELKKATSQQLTAVQADLKGLNERHVAQKNVLVAVQAAEEALSDEVSSLKSIGITQRETIATLTEERDILSSSFTTAGEENVAALATIDQLEKTVARQKDRINQLEGDASEHADRLKQALALNIAQERDNVARVAETKVRFLNSGFVCQLRIGFALVSHWHSRSYGDCSPSNHACYLSMYFIC